MKRYNHWFWNSKFMIKTAQQISYLSTWLWNKMYSGNR